MKSFLKAGTVIALTVTLANCTKKSDDASTSSALGISGKLSTSASLMSQQLKTAGNTAFEAVTLTDLEVQATAFTEPPQVVTGAVNADGSFSVSIPGAKGVPVTAAFIDKNDQSQVGQIVFEDTSSKDLNGNASQTSTAVLNDSVPLGAITLGSDGKVKIPVSQVASVLGSAASVSAATAFDPTGSWYMKAFDGTLPSGYQTVGSTCGQGPCIGFPITLVRLAGKKFTATAGHCDPTASPVTCDPAAGDGTVGTEDRYALSIWGDTFANGIGACGSKVGFTADEARAFGQISVDTLPSVEGHSISFGPYVYSTPTGFGGDASPFDKPWMKTAAKALHDQMDCRRYTVTNGGVSYNAWACKAKVMSGAWPGSQVGTSVGWNIGVEGGGCFNSTTGKPINVTNWANMGYGTCAQSAATAYGTGFYTNTCTFSNVDHDGDSSTAPINVSCTNTGGQFQDSSGPTTTPLSLSAGQYLGQPTALVTYNQNCSTIGHADDAQTLAAYRCYAENYWTANTSGVACKRDYRFNWAATTPAEFAQDSERGKPNNAFVTNILNYSPDGQTASLEDEQNENVTIMTGPNSSTFCQASRRTVISFKKLTESRMLIDLRQTGQMNSTDAACIGAAKAALSNAPNSDGHIKDILTPMKMIFYADKTL